MADLPEWAYVHVHNWARHQHYKGRRPLWIKSYIEQIHNEDYLALTAAERGILHGARLAYAELQTTPELSRGLPGSTAEMSRVLRLSVLRRQLLSLNHAGLIDFSASRVIAQLDNPASAEGEGEGELEKNSPLPPSIEPALVVVLKPESEAAFLILAAIDKPGYQPPKFTRARFAPVVDKHLVADLVGECEKLADWETYGGGAGKPTQPKDGIARFRNWLAKVPASPVEEPYVVGGGIYPPYDPKIHPHYPDNTDPFELRKPDDEEAA